MFVMLLPHTPAVFFLGGGGGVILPTYHCTVAVVIYDGCGLLYFIVLNSNHLLCTARQQSFPIRTEKYLIHANMQAAVRACVRACVYSLTGQTRLGQLQIPLCSEPAL